MNNYFSITTLSLSIVLAIYSSQYALAATISTAHQMINIGSRALPPGQDVGEVNPFYSQPIIIPAACNSDAECEGLTISWIPMDSSRAELSHNGVNIFKLGTTGIAASVKFDGDQSGLTYPQPGKSFRLNVGLFKTTDTVDTGTINASQTLFKQIIDKKGANGVVTESKQTLFTLQSNIVSASCLLTTKALTITLPTVTSDELATTVIHSRVEGRSGQQTVQAICAGVEKMSLAFHSGNIIDDPTLLNATLLNGNNSGLAFKLFYRMGEEFPVYWDNTHTIDLNKPTYVSIPLTAYYIKEQNSVTPGNIKATGGFTITYQ